ncbi:RXLR domain-containing protein [Phytophthora infestans]|uniref:RxLR effector protein n=1 Tax=Phytophthora infestans TaxID=4787 RepID=A0A833TQN7_PHYIN|nr:RXLR domain-containing protein [Phytophthora infestans]
MRLTYILGVVLAVTLHASSTAITATKDSDNMTGKYVSAEVVNEDDGRLLRRVEPLASHEDGIEEERFLGALKKLMHLRSAAKLRTNNYEAAKVYNRAAKFLKKQT